MQKISFRDVGSWLFSAIVAVAAFKYGYGFGLEVSGVLLGAIAGINCAIFGVVMSDAVLARLVSVKPSIHAAE
jgi:hypothetical protein